MKLRDYNIKLSSELTRITTITYRCEPSRDPTTLIGPVCNRLRERILRLGKRSGDVNDSGRRSEEMGR